MTNDYKDKLLKYLTGNITNETNSNIPYYETKTSYENNDLIALGFTYSYTIDTLYCRNANGELTGNMLVYGNGINSSNNWNGFILLVDSDFKVLKTFTEYDSGTNFDIFEVLNIDEKGQVYGIDYSSNKHRLIMLNNISEKGNLPDYQCILRQSYFLQGDIQNTFIDVGAQNITSDMLCIEKSKQSALYFIAGMDGGQDILYATSFRINVGAQNEWTQFDFGVLYQGLYLDSYVYFDVDDNINCNFFFEETNIGNNTHKITRNYNVGTSISGYETLIENLEGYITNIFNIKGLALNQNKIYVGIGGNEDLGGTYKEKLKVLLYDSGNISVIYEKEEETLYNYGTSMRFTSTNNQVFIEYLMVNDVINDEIVGDIYVNLLNEDNIDYEMKIDDCKAYYNGIINEAYFGVSNKFNLYNILVSFYPAIQDEVSDFTTFSTKIVCRNGYNGEEKEDTNSLLPTQGLLFDENNSLIFARDLYNNKTYNNRSISVLNVPNTFLNEVSIEKENLLGATNTTLVENSEEITKNIYEDLYINFNNQITMSNQNTSNYIDNLTGAIRLNQSSGKVLDYDNAKATKIRVTYDDDTSYITSASNTITNNICTYSIGIAVPNDRNIQSIEIISNDENTTYQTITNLNLENNKYYIITQDVYVV